MEERGRTPGRVVAVVVTYERLELLRESLTAVLGQTRTPDAVVVVDNASTDGTADAVATEFPSVDLFRLRVNTGGAGGFSAGLERALGPHAADPIHRAAAAGHSLHGGGDAGNRPVAASDPHFLT